MNALKVYIAGQITGLKNYKDKFNKASKAYSTAGFSVLNPATLPPNMSRSDYMRICFAMIDTADIVIFLDNFRQSDGARLEYNYCKYIEKSVILLD